MDHILENVPNEALTNVKSEDFWLNICQIAVILISALLFAIGPSLLVWKFHIMSLSDPAVIMGLAACYILAAILVVFDISQIRKLL